MPVNKQQAKGTRAARELWKEITADHGLVGHLEYGPVHITCGFCQDHNVYEVALTADNEPFGIGTLESEADLARVVDAVICFADLARNLALELTQSHHTHVKSVRSA